MLGCIQPMSSPIMKRIFGFCSCATAGTAEPTVPKPAARIAATAVIASVLEGDLTDASGAAALFIDWFAARGGGGGVVVGGRPAWHGAWYAHPGAAFAAGAAVGAAVAHPYYYGAPPCGYYPYPPCY
jgi:hypothetical protein